MKSALCIVFLLSSVTYGKEATLLKTEFVPNNIDEFDRNLQGSIDEWSPYGTWTGGAFEENLGEYVALSGDGSRMVTSGMSQVLVYTYDSSIGDWDNGVNLDRSFTERGIVPVAISDTGTAIIIGGMFNNEFGFHAGAAIVYGFDDADDTWKQLGRTLNGDSANDLFGYSVAISASGTFIVVGAKVGEYVRLYEYLSNTGQWDQVSEFIDPNPNISFGHGVAISGVGDRVAIGAPHGQENKGFVRIFDLSGGNIVMVTNLNGPFDDDRFGSQVALSLNGRTLAVSTFEDASQPKEDFVRMFDYDLSTQSWARKGNDIDYDSEGLGGGISLSLDGSLIAVGIITQSDITRFGESTIYQYDGTDWVAYIGTMSGSQTFELCGVSVAISSNGMNLAYGCPGNNDAISGGGKVSVTATLPSDQPSLFPSVSPSTLPSMVPSSVPTKLSSVQPSIFPSRKPTSSPTRTIPSLTFTSPPSPNPPAPTPPSPTPPSPTPPSPTPPSPTPPSPTPPSPTPPSPTPPSPTPPSPTPPSPTTPSPTPPSPTPPSPTPPSPTPPSPTSPSPTPPNVSPTGTNPTPTMSTMPSIVPTLTDLNSNSDGGTPPDPEAVGGAPCRINRYFKRILRSLK